MVEAMVVTNQCLLIRASSARVHRLVHIRLTDRTVSVVEIHNLLAAYQRDFYLYHGSPLFTVAGFSLTLQFFL